MSWNLKKKVKMTFSMVSSSFALLMALTVLLSWTIGVEAELIPNSFMVKDISEYKIRYLSEKGNDTDSCLFGQVYPPSRRPDTAVNTIQHCGSLLYALTGNHRGRDSYIINNTIVLILPGSYLIGSEGVKIINSQNVIIRKVPDIPGEVILRCNEFIEEDDFNNLYMRDVTNLALIGIIFSDCGPRTSPVALQRPINAVVSDCTFRRNRNCGLTIDSSTQFLAVNSLFHDNNSTAFYKNSDRLDPGVFRFGGGLLLNWDSRVRNQSLSSNTALVKNCTFFNNYVGINERNSNDTRPHFYRPRGHGGAIVVAFKNTTNHNLVVENCQIYNNTAQYGGGGILLSYFRNAYNNTVVIKGTNFEDNVCMFAGGAINMNAFEMANENVLNVTNSRFTRNIVNDGGGGACIVNLRDNLQTTVSQVNELITNTATFVNCIFTNNSSPSGAGSAVKLVSNLRVDQIAAATEFTNCTFVGNHAERKSAVLSFRYPIIFSGKNIFRGNRGGGLTLQQTNVDIGGTLHFEDNSARVGGAISLEDLCVVYLLQGSKVLFIRNSAEMQGGAISALFPSDSNVLPIFNTRCFIQYKGNIELDSSEWNTSLIFINNTAVMDGAAIYATSISRCIYTPTNVTGTTTYDTSIFRVSPPFTFSGNRLNSSNARSVETLATAPSSLRVTPQNITAAPGETVQFLVKAIDQAGNAQEAIWSRTEKSEIEDDFVGGGTVGDYFGSLAEGINHTLSIQKVNRDLYYDNCLVGIPRSITFSIVQAIAGDVSNGTTVKVNVSCCHPGYHFDDKTEVCEHNHNDRNIVRPDANNKYLYTKDNIYVNKSTVINNGTEELKTAVIPPTFHHCQKQGAQPGCKFKFDSLEEQCSERRRGFLCGQCSENEGVDLTLRGCKKCSVGDAIIVALIVLAFIIISLLVLYFNIGIPNELKGCLFFIQVVGFVYQSSRTDEITWDYHLSRVFGSGLYLPLCPAPGLPALYTAIYGLLFSILAISILAIYIMSARCSRRLSSRSSFEGIWLLSLVTYKYTADTCFNLLRCQKVSGKGISGEFVYYYDGTVPCLKSTHLYISIVALLLTVVVVVPFPLLIFLISFRRFKFTQPFTDVLNRDIKVNCRWWSGFDLLRRLLFITVVFFFNYVEPRYTQLALFFTGLLTFSIFASSKPYQKQRANIIEAAALLNLLFLTSLFLNVSLSIDSLIVRIFEQTLLLLPFLLIGTYIIIRLVGLIWKRFSRKSFKMFIGDIVDRSRKQHTNVSHDLELLTNMELEAENSEFDSEDDRDTPVYREELILENN